MLVDYVKNNKFVCVDECFQCNPYITHLIEIDKSSKSPILDSYFKSSLGQNKLLADLFSRKLRMSVFKVKLGMLLVL
jgi:excinuclease UvrABC helicase subunit UvrB